MIRRTSSEIAPWTLVAANDKYHARMHVLSTLCAGLEEALGEDREKLKRPEKGEKRKQKKKRKKRDD
jgi:hypothetical protein